jgi:integrase
MKNERSTKKWGSVNRKITTAGNIKYYASYIMNGVRYNAGSFDYLPEAEKYLAKIKALIDFGQWKPTIKKQDQQANMSFNDYALDYLANDNIKGSTRYNYLKTFNNHIKDFFKKKRLNDIVDTDIIAWYDGLDNSKPHMKGNAYIVIRKIFKNALFHKIINDDPSYIHGAGRKNRTVKIDLFDLSALEFNTILGYLPKRYRLIAIIGLNTGLRLSEVVALKKKDINLEKLYLSVNKNASYGGIKVGEIITTTKTINSNRTIQLPSTIKKKIQEHYDCYKTENDDFIFLTEDETRITTRKFQRYFRFAVDKANRPDLSFHKLRHLHLTNLARAGATTYELMRQAGHSDPKTAMVYQELSSERKKELAEKFNPFA